MTPPKARTRELDDYTVKVLRRIISNEATFYRDQLKRKDIAPGHWLTECARAVYALNCVRRSLNTTVREVLSRRKRQQARGKK